ncbi:MAG: hypothetical protein IT460_10165 [Planctomycetes bacterium]|nr:hypothetical protein [Planctomycetota bacterium]
MALPPPTSREVLHRNPYGAGDPRHADQGDAVLEALLCGTDAEGFAGDRVLMGRARAALAADTRFGAATVGEAYRLRSADRVEVLYLRVEANPRPVPGLPGRHEVGLVHAVEVTRTDALAFRTSPCWRRAGGRGWVLFDPGDGAPVERTAGREALQAAQDASLSRGLALEVEAFAAAAAFGARRVVVADALRATSLPRSVRERAGAALAAVAPLCDVVVALADVAGAADREEGETYARAAGRLLARGAAVVAAAAASSS